MKILRQDTKIDLTQLSFAYTWQTLGKIYIGNELVSKENHFHSLPFN